MKYQPITIHHRLPESWGGNLRPNNSLPLREKVHQALHTVYSNDTPVQRIRRTLEADKPVMRPDIYKVISDTLKRFEGVREIESYEPDCFNSDTFLHQYGKIHL